MQHLLGQLLHFVFAKVVFNMLLKKKKNDATWISHVLTSDCMLPRSLSNYHEQLL